MKGEKMKISARNVLKGKVVKFSKGAINAEIVIEIAGGAKVTSIITLESAKTLGIAEGKDVYAIIKASDVMVGID
jgi:molybdopterin-binding protein